MADNIARTPPPRPALPATPPPVKKLAPTTGAISASRSVWWASLAIGLAAIVFGFLWRDVQIERLQEVVQDLEIDLTTDERNSLSALLYYSSLAALTVITALETFLLARMLRQRSGFRWALAAVFLLHVGVALVASALTSIGSQGILIAALLLSQAVLAGAALLLSFLPSANRWFRLRHEAEGASPA